MDNWKLVSILLIGIVLGYIGGRVECSLSGCEVGFTKTEVAAEKEAPTPQAPQADPVLNADDQELLVEDDDPMLGDEDAPVTIVEFSDYQCPFCKRYATETFSLIKENFIDTGNVKYYFRDFPLGFHPQAKGAAKTANCAGVQSKYWEMHDTLFANQDEWAGSAEADQLFVGYAKELGLDTTKLETCMKDPKVVSEVDNDIATGSRLGASGTPSFFINGKLLVGAQPYSTFKSTIEAALQE